MYSSDLMCNYLYSICELDGVALTANTNMGQFDCRNSSIATLDQLAFNFSTMGIDPGCSLNNLTVNPSSVSPDSELMKLQLLALTIRIIMSQLNTF